MGKEEIDITEYKDILNKQENENYFKLEFEDFFQLANKTENKDYRFRQIRQMLNEDMEEVNAFLDFYVFDVNTGQIFWHEQQLVKDEELEQLKEIEDEIVEAFAGTSSYKVVNEDEQIEPLVMEYLNDMNNKRIQFTALGFPQTSHSIAGFIQSKIEDYNNEDMKHPIQQKVQRILESLQAEGKDKEIEKKRKEKKNNMIESITANLSQDPEFEKQNNITLKLDYINKNTTEEQRNALLEKEKELIIGKVTQLNKKKQDRL